jgi:hypothetical protein
MSSLPWPKRALASGPRFRQQLLSAEQASKVKLQPAPQTVEGFFLGAHSRLAIRAVARIKAVLYEKDNRSTINLRGPARNYSPAPRIGGGLLFNRPRNEFSELS